MAKTKTIDKVLKGHREYDMFDMMQQAETPLDLDFIIDTPGKAEAVLPLLQGVEFLSLDTEGTGLNPGPDDLTLDNDTALWQVSDLFAGFSFAISGTQAWYVPTRHYQARVLDRMWVRRLMDACLSARKIRMHNARHDLKVLCGYYHQDVYDQMRIRDSLVGIHTLFQSEEGADKSKRNQLGLKKLARQILNRNAGEFDGDWLGPKILRAPIELLARYAADDAINTFLIGEWADSETTAQGTAPYLEEVGFPLIQPLARAHRYGIALDRDKLKEFKRQSEEKMAELHQQLCDAAGGLVNPNSGFDMDRLIYDTLKMPQVGERNDKGLRPLAAEDLKEVIETAQLMNKLDIQQFDDASLKYISNYQEFQSLSTIHGTFIVSLLDKSAKDGRIYPTIKQTGTVSGRAASTDPNGQNIVTGRKALIAGLNLDIRSCFMPDEGCCFITLDESALEMRILAHFSEETALVDSLHKPKKEGGDPHQAAADQVSKATGKLLTRDAAKTVQFGIVYGMSEHGLSLKLCISIQDAKDLIAAYYAGMPMVRSWKDMVEAEIRKTGTVRTLLNRIRRTELHRNKNRTVVDGAIRSVLNSKIQGSGADIINSAIVKIHYNEEFQRLGARIALQVHDELLTNCPIANADRAEKIMRFYMENPFGNRHLKVPLCVEGGHGPHWAH